MQILGYIVAKGKIRYDNCFIKKVEDISLVDKTKPYIVCGLSEAKKIASDNFSILDKKIGDNAYWTFGRTEKRDEHEADIMKFCRMVVENYFNGIKYFYLNVCAISIDSVKRTIKFINSSVEKYIYIWNDMLYVTCPNSTSMGVSLRICEYMGINRQKILDIVKSCESNIVFDDDNCIPKNLKYFLKDKAYIVPFIIQTMKQ